MKLCISVPMFIGSNIFENIEVSEEIWLEHGLWNDKKKKKKSGYPSFCPNPEPGTVEMPVASNSLRQ